jgi:hypothetical protein
MSPGQQWVYLLTHARLVWIVPLVHALTRTREAPAIQRGRGGYHWGTMSRRRQARDIIAQLEDQRTRLEGVRERARRQGGPEGERLDAQAAVRLREIEQRIEDLRASLG